MKVLFENFWLHIFFLHTDEATRFLKEILLLLYVSNILVIEKWIKVSFFAIAIASQKCMWFLENVYNSVIRITRIYKNHNNG